MRVFIPAFLSVSTFLIKSPKSEFGIYKLDEDDFSLVVIFSMDKLKEFLGK